MGRFKRYRPNNGTRTIQDKLNISANSYLRT